MSAMASEHTELSIVASDVFSASTTRMDCGSSLNSAHTKHNGQHAGAHQIPFASNTNIAHRRMTTVAFTRDGVEKNVSSAGSTSLLVRSGRTVTIMVGAGGCVRACVCVQAKEHWIVLP